MKSRVENILTAIIDGDSSSTLPPPQSRNEALLLQVLDKINGIDERTKALKTGYYAVCNSNGDAQIKEISLEGVETMDTGLSVHVKFTNAQTYDGIPELKINSLAAKPISRNGYDSASMNEWDAGEVLEFAYDGTNWVIVNGGNLKIR